MLELFRRLAGTKRVVWRVIELFFRRWLVVPHKAVLFLILVRFLLSEAILLLNETAVVVVEAVVLVLELQRGIIVFFEVLRVVVAGISWWLDEFRVFDIADVLLVLIEILLLRWLSHADEVDVEEGAASLFQILCRFGRLEVRRRR